MAYNSKDFNSKIRRLETPAYQIYLKNTEIHNQDFEEFLREIHPNKNDFIFLDPPYYSTTNSRLYGKNGDLHASFDHKRFANVMKNCNHKWLITYDDCNEIRNLFNFAEIFPWSLQYGLNIIDQETPGRGKELFIANYSYQRMNFQINLERE